MFPNVFPLLPHVFSMFFPCFSQISPRFYHVFRRFLFWKKPPLAFPSFQGSAGWPGRSSAPPGDRSCPPRPGAVRDRMVLFSMDFPWVLKQISMGNSLGHHLGHHLGNLWGIYGKSVGHHLGNL